MRMIIAFLTVVGLPVHAQTSSCADTSGARFVDLSAWERDLLRARQLDGTTGISERLWLRSSTAPNLSNCVAAPPPGASDSDKRHVSLRLVAISGRLESNSDYRRDRNNGTLRGDVGASMVLTAGLEAQWKWFSVAVVPAFVRHSNGEVRARPNSAPNRSEWSNPYQPLDLPQRYGSEGETRIYPGQSYIRFGTRHFEVGAGTENVWLGPAQYYPLFLSSTAGGFPHAFAGTVEPLNAWIADIGFHVIWGRLSESEFFDNDPDNDHRIFAAFALEAQPRWIPGLSLGAARISHEIIPPEGASARDYFVSPFGLSPTYEGGGNAEDGNALGALYARWVFPEVGFEAYAEWGRDDTPYDVYDLLAEPDWTQAYTLGFQQLVDLNSLELRWYAELVHLGEAAPVRAGKGLASFYTHSRAVQGHTHEGQMLGAAPGPGSDAQILGVDVAHKYGLSGLWFERTRTDEDTYYRRWAVTYGESRHDLELGVGLRHRMDVGPVHVAGEMIYTSRANRGFLNLEDRELPRLVEKNVGLNLRVEWDPKISFRW